MNFNGLLCGHKHDNNADSLTTNVGSLFTSNTGCVYQSREYFNGYSIVDLDADGRQWVVSAREYYVQRGKFDVAPRFGPDGRGIYPLLGTSTAVPRISIPGVAIRAVQERANAQLLSHSASEVAPRSLGALFVEPPLSTISEKEMIAKADSGSKPKEFHRSLASLGSAEEAIFFVGKRETGKSMLLHQIAVNHFQAFSPRGRLGVVVDIHVAKKLTEAGLLQQAVEFCGGEIPRRDLIRLLEDGEVVVCVDNLDIHDQNAVDLMRDFVAKYSKCRYIFAGSEELLDDLSTSVLPDLGVPTLKIYVHSFRSRHTKELVRRWFGSGDLAINKRVQTVNQLLDRLRVPRTPFLVSVLAWVLEQRPQANVINRAAAIDVLVDGLLDKFRESKSRREFDSTIQRHFLGELAVELDRLDSEWMTRLQFDEFVVSYFKRRGLAVSTDGFAADLVRKGLLYSADDRAGFKFDCFRAFFLAKKFSEVPALWQLALNPDRVSRYVVELDLFTGLSRDRTDVLRLAKTLCQDTFKRLELDFEPGDVERVAGAEVQADQSLLTIIESQVGASSGWSHEEEQDIPDVVSADHEEARKRKHMPEMGEVGRFVESLRAFSMILRNSELVDDVELKRECFDVALEHWANTAIAVMLATIEEAKQYKLRRAAGQEVDLASKEPEVTFFVRALIPQMVVAVMCECLATAKLGLFVQERVDDRRTLIRALAVFLALETGEDGALFSARQLAKEFKNNGFVLQMLFFRMLAMYIGAPEGAIGEKVREFIGELFLLLKGGSFKDGAITKARFLANLDKKFGAS